MNYTSIYNSLNEVEIDNYNYFSHKIELQYFKLKKYEYQINNDSCPIIDFDDLESSSLKDRFLIKYKGYDFDCLLTQPIKDIEDKTLFVIFSGSREINIDKLPIFKRWSYYQFIDSYVLNIADPMFYKYDKLSLGWYYGSENESCIEYLADIIDKVKNNLCIDNKKIIFFGSSGGGYVALMMSLYFRDTLHIAINPQIQINQFYGQNFPKVTGIDLNKKDLFRRNETISIIQERCLNKYNKFLLLQNITDEHDCTCHLFPLMKKMNIDKLQFGLNTITSDMLCWIYSCVGGHNAQGDQYIFSLMLHLAKKLLNNETIDDNDRFMYKVISCIWHQNAWLLDAFNKQLRELKQLKQE